MSSKATDVTLDAALLYLANQQHEVLDAVAGMKASQDVMVHDWQQTFKRVEDKLDSQLNLRRGAVSRSETDQERNHWIQVEVKLDSLLQRLGGEHWLDVSPSCGNDMFWEPAALLKPACEVGPRIQCGDLLHEEVKQLAAPLARTDTFPTAPPRETGSQSGMLNQATAQSPSLPGQISPRPDSPDAITRPFRMKPAKSFNYRSAKRKHMNESVDKVILASKRQELESRQPWLRKFARSKVFEILVSVCILLNSFFIGWETQAISGRVEDSFEEGTAYEDLTIPYFVTIQVIFTFGFTLDVCVRWHAEGGTAFLIGSDWAWNSFDLLAVALGIIDLLMELLKIETSLSSVTVVRILRILRLVRVVRVIRTYSFFHELRMMVESCLCGLKSYMWCCLVIFMLLYIFGVSMTTNTYTYLAREEKYSDDPDAVLLQSSFGTLDKSMLSLFQSITGGRDWGELYPSLVQVGALECLLYWLFLSFSMFAVTSAVAAVFVESAMLSSRRDRELRIRDTLQQAVDYQHEMLNVFAEMDADDTGTISFDEFLTHLDDDRVRAYFETLNLDVSDPVSLFSLLDADRSGKVDLQEFIEGCRSLKGVATSLEMRCLRSDLSEVKRDLERLVGRDVVLQEMRPNSRGWVSGVES